MPGIKRRSDQDGLGLGLSSTLAGQNPSFLDGSGSNKRSKSRLATADRSGLGDEGENVLWDESVLMKSLKDAGYVVKTGGITNILKEDHAIFLKKFNRDITTQDDYPANIEKMTETLSSWMEDERFLVKCLSPTDTSVACDTARSAKQDSLLRLLLNVDDIQPRLLGLLLEKLAETSIVQEGTEHTQAENIPRLILSSMRWLDRIVDGEGIAEKMREILSVTSPYHQVEVVAALPEILPPGQHDNIATLLHQLLEEAPAQVSCLVDCLGNLNLSMDLVDTTKSVLLSKMAKSSFQLSDLPTVVDYLLSPTCRRPDTLNTLIKEVRENLELTEKVKPSQRAGPASAKSKDLRDNNSKKSIECIILNKINIAMLTEKKMNDAWYNALDSVKEQEEMKPLDFLVMVMMYKNKQRRKSAEALIKSKFRHAVLTLDLIVSTFEQHPTALREWSDSVLDLADTLISSADKTVSEGLGKQLFVSVFTGLGEHCQRLVVTQLVTLVSRASSALLTLSQLSSEHGDLLAKYGWYIIGLLDHVSESTEVGKVRDMVRVLSRLAWRKGPSTAGQQIRDDIVIFVKKQVQSGVVEYKRMGVVGAVVVASAMATAWEEEDIGVPLAESSRSSRSNTSLVLTELAQEAWDLLNFTESKVSSHPELAGLFFDEMCVSFISYLEDAEKNFVVKFKERFSTNLEDDYIEDILQQEDETYGIRMTCDLLLDTDLDDSEKAISLNLASKVCVALGVGPTNLPSVRNKASARLATMTPRLRLLCKTIYLSSEGELSDIDALLGCGVWLFPEEIIESLKEMQVSEKNAVLNTLFYAVNWFIELLNGFSTQSDDEDVRRKVLVRLKHVVAIRKSLETGLRCHATYRPPTVLFGENVSSWQPPAASHNKKAQKSGDKKGGKGKKSSKVPTDTMMNATMNLNTQRTTQTQPPKNSQKTSTEESILIVDLQQYKAFFRELDLSCLNVLETEPLTTGTAPEMVEEISEPKLRPPEFLFLLKDLQVKVDKVLSGKKTGFPGKQSTANVGLTNISQISSKDVAIIISKKFKYIFAHLDELKKFFGRLGSIHGDVVDLITVCNSDALVSLEAVKTGLQVVTTFFSWPGFASAVNESLLKTSLYNIAHRVVEVSSRDSVQDLAGAVIKYLNTFTKASLSIDVAAAQVSLMSTLAKFNDSKEVMEVVATTVEKYLRRDWKMVTGEPEKGAGFNSQIEKLLHIFVASSRNIYKDLLNLCEEGTCKVFEKEEEENRMFPIINKGTLATVYKVLLPSLVLEVKKMSYGSTKDQDLQLRQWSQAIRIFVRMVLDLKKYCNRGLLTQILKNSRYFLDHFIKEGMVLVEKNFNRRRAEGLSLMTSLQKGTRYLQTICAHSKIERDIALSAKVPFLKKSLETLLFATKASLAANNCVEAFEIGQLKNRNIYGEEIQSQQEEDTPEDDGEEEEYEEGEDDDDGEEEIVIDANDISEEV